MEEKLLVYPTKIFIDVSDDSRDGRIHLLFRNREINKRKSSIGRAR